VPAEKPLECFVDKVAGLVSASPGQLGGPPVEVARRCHLPLRIGTTPGDRIVRANSTFSEV